MKLNEDTGLTLQQEEFCVLYASVEEFFGNGVQSYIEVYQPNQTKPNWYAAARASASRLMAMDKITKRINEILEETGMSDEWVTKQHSFLISQHADLPTKMQAINSYYKVKGKFAPDKVVVTIPKPLMDLTENAAK